jgi:hypothetical protein
MVSVSIFALRDVIRKVQKEFVTPFNSIAHTSPTTSVDIKILTDYLYTQQLQTYTPHREHNDDALEARDLFQVGAEYANKPSAFRNFTYTEFKTTNHGVAGTTVSQIDEGNDDLIDDELQGPNSIDADADLQVELADLLLDEDEYPLGMDSEDCLHMFTEVIQELGRF